ncbi:MAG TPA: hypothetical protein VMD47_03335 [Candidatus Acidoferrales bacterium]|nr:hypothetical protein [Candidatus Acidoferrales bacterium]
MRTIRTLRVVVDAVAIVGLIVLFAFALERGWHWRYWRIPVVTLAVYLFSWTLERFPERTWIHRAIAGVRVVIVLAAAWAEFQLPR